MYSKKDISDILACSYYDQRTDYVWQHIVGSGENKERFQISSLESFLAMSEMLRHRSLDIAQFLNEWDTTEHSGLIECKYNGKTGILHLRTRTYKFTYRSKTNEYDYSVYTEVARNCLLVKKETHKKYVKGGLFPLSYLVELDEQLYSRSESAQRLNSWKKSRQCKLDIEYCRKMLPVIMRDAKQLKKKLTAIQRLQVILEGNDHVRIGWVERYSPEEMLALPSYPREEWQLGIQRAFEQLDYNYNQKIENVRLQMVRLSEEMTQITLRKLPFDTYNNGKNYGVGPNYDAYSFLLTDEVFGNGLKHQKWSHQKELFQPIINYVAFQTKVQTLNHVRYEADTFIAEIDSMGKTATITMKDEVIAQALDIEPVCQIPDLKKHRLATEMFDLYDKYIKQKYEDHLFIDERLKRPQHRHLVEALKHIVDITSPLINYAGDYDFIQENYSLNWNVDSDDNIRISVKLRHNTKRESFTLDDYKSRFRVWWSQQLLSECKFAKEASLNPEQHLNNDQPF